MRNIVIALCGAAGIIFFSGCLRFVPSRESLSGRSADAVGGEQDFRAFEEKLRAEKTRFVEERRLAGAGGQQVPNYQIGPGDVVNVEVFGFQDLSARARVRPTGAIALPLLDEIGVAGLTEEDLQQLLENRFKPYVRQPRVKVAIEEYRAHRVSAMGAVTRPGEYPLRSSDYTLLDLLSEAGGRTQTSGRRIVLIPAERRRFGGEPPDPQRAAAAESGGVEFDIDEFYGDAGNPPLVVPLVAGDSVVVPEAGTFSVIGEVKNPGAFPLAARTSILGAIAAAGGLEYSADVGKVELIRNTGENKQAMLAFDLDELAVAQGRDIALRNGDVVRVPSGRTRFIQRQIVEFFHGLLNFGYSA